MGSLANEEMRISKDNLFRHDTMQSIVQVLAQFCRQFSHVGSGQVGQQICWTSSKSSALQMWWLLMW